MIGLLLALTASVSWGLSDFLAGVTGRRAAVPIILAVSQLAGMAVLAVPLVVRQQPVHVGEFLVPAIVAGVSSPLALGLLYHAMTVGTVAVVAPIAATGAVLPVVVGVARGDAMTSLIFAGMVLALVGAMFAAFEPGDDGLRSGRPVSGALYAFASAVALGFFFVMLDVASESDPYGATFSMRAVACATVLLFLLIRRRKLGPAGRPSSWPTWVGIVGIGLFDSVAEISFAVASTTAQLGVVSVLSSLYPVVTVLLAVLVLRERVRLTQAVGVAGALLGVLLISHAA